MINYLNVITLIGTDTSQYLYGKLHKAPFSKKDNLVTLGQKCNKMWYLEKGAAIIYAVNGHGKKVITDIVIGPGIIWLPEYSQQHPFSRHCIKVVGNSEMQWIDYGDIWQELQQFEEFRFIENALIRMHSIASEEKFLMMREQMIGERYRRCLVLYPGIENLLTGMTIAQFLNTSPETISRVKAQMK